MKYYTLNTVNEFSKISLIIFSFYFLFLNQITYAQTTTALDSLIYYLEDDFIKDGNKLDEEEYSIEPQPYISPLEPDLEYMESTQPVLSEFNDSIWGKKKDEFRFDEKTLPQKEKNKSHVNIDTTWFKTIVYFIAISILLIFILFIAGKFIKGNRLKTKQVIQINFEEMDENTLKTLNTFSLIKKALKENNYQLAYRLYYLELLKQLTLRNHIQFKKELTNYDYLVLVSGLPVYELFKKLTEKFDLYWYGEFQLTETEYLTQVPFFEKALQLIEKGVNQ